MTTATMTAPIRAMRQPVRKTERLVPRVRAQALEDPYQGFSKEDYEDLLETVRLDKAGKIKWEKHDLIDA